MPNLYIPKTCITLTKNRTIYGELKKGAIQMKKQDANNQSYYEMDEKGTNEVSEQITNAYNSGVIDYSEEQIQKHNKKKRH